MITLSDKLELAIFGYIDPMGKLEGSYGAELLKAAIEDIDKGESFDDVVRRYKPAIDSIHAGIRILIEGK